MVRKTLIELYEERGRLRERIAMQRRELRQQLAPVSGVLQAGDRAMQAGRDAVDTLLKHPVALAAIAAAMVAVKPRVIWRWGRRGWVIWRGWRLVSRWLPGMLDRWPGAGPSRKA